MIILLNKIESIYLFYNIVLIILSILFYNIKKKE